MLGQLMLVLLRLAGAVYVVLGQLMLVLLLLAGAVYVVLGDRQEAALLLASIGLIIGIELYQERRTERALEALRDLSSPRALVVRDGERRRIAGREVVRDDVVVLGEGDRVPADGVLSWSSHLEADESLLTGESAAVQKQAAPAERREPMPDSDDDSHVYSGALITSGQGLARVTATGAATKMGRIGGALQSLRPEPTGLQRETDRVVRVVAVVAAAACLLMVVAYGLTRASLLDGLLAGLTLAMALIPEEFPVVLTVFLALGAWRIARSQVLTRRAPAMDALGAATVLCVDKTGTLTENRMTVTRLVLPDESLDVEGGPVPPAFHHLIDLAFLASAVDPFDPMERAIHRLYDAKGEAMRMRHAERGTQIGARRSSPAEWGGELDRLAAGASRSVEHEAGVVEPGTGTAALGSSSAGAARM